MNCSKGGIFSPLDKVNITIEQLQQHHQRNRLHSTLGYRPPAPETIMAMNERPLMNQS